MIGYSKETSLDSPQIIERAVQFFGPQGMGLQVTELNEHCVRFAGDGGLVNVHLVPSHDKTAVGVESQVWATQAREFLGLL